MSVAAGGKIGPARQIQQICYRIICKLMNPIVNFHRLETKVVVGDAGRLSISPSASVHNAYFNVLSGSIGIGAHVFFGYHVTVLAGTHDYHRFGYERMLAVPQQGHDIIIEDGAWIASNATLVGPCRIGRNAVVAAGAVVVDDVAPFTVVGGVPARFIRTIDKTNEADAILKSLDNR
jgi:acetyltransferase-like isoleucine patch superfamily enzyme